jgi:uncharacterized protein with HEPN domain
MQKHTVNHSSLDVGHARPSIADYLTRIIEAMSRIDRYTRGMDEVAFLNNQLVQDAVVRNFEIICEAGGSVEKHYPEPSEIPSEMEWGFVRLVRTVVAPGAFAVDFARVWQIVESEDAGYFYTAVHRAVREVSAP